MKKSQIIAAINADQAYHLQSIRTGTTKFKKIAPVLAQLTNVLEGANVFHVGEPDWNGSTYDLSLYVGGTCPSINVYLKGNDTLKRVLMYVLPHTVSALRFAYGNAVERKDNSIGDTRVGLWWTLDETWFSFHLNFYLSDSRVCSRVQVGTKMVEQAVYEVRCEDGSPPPSVLDEDTERLLAV